MANSSIEKYRFVTEAERYTWQVADFANLQQWIFDTIAGLGEGALGVGVLSGLTWTPLSGLTVRVAPGIALTAAGELLVNPSNADITFTSPLGNPAKSLLVIRPLKTDTNLIPIPLTPSSFFNFNTIQGMQILALNGTPAVSPSYPSLGTDDCRIAGFNLSAGQVTIAQGNLDPDQRDVPSIRNRRRITRITADYSPATRDDIIEINAAGGNIAVTLPDNLANHWRALQFIRTDNSANTVSIVPAGSDTIVGDGAFTLDAQWQTAQMISAGTGDWRVF